MQKYFCVRFFIIVNHIQNWKVKKEMGFIY